MAATTTTTSAAAAAAATSFYTTLNYKSWPINDHHQIFRISFNKKVCHQSPTLLSHSYGTFNELNFISKRNVSRIAAAVEAVEDAAEAETVVEPEEESGSGANTKLYFGNLPYLCDSAQLAGIIQEYASPELVEVLYDRNTGKSRGFAFVTMSSVEDCKNVIENLDGSQYGGRTLRVNFSDKPKPKEPLYPETEYKLFVGNLSWSVTSEILTEAFRAHGNVVGARVLYDGETGRSRGYGFVCYETRDEMETAIQALNEVELEGRTLRVSLAEGKKQ